MKSIVILSALGLVLLLAAVIGYQEPSVALQNRTGAAISEFELSIGGEPVARGALPSGTLDRHSLPSRKEGPMRLSLRFADGRTGEVDAGWFSPGQADGAQIAVFAPDSARVEFR